MLGQIILQVVLIGLNAIFACAEIAIISMNDAKLSHMAAEGDKRAARLVKLTSQPARFLATIQVAITLSGFLGSAFAADSFSSRLVSVLLAWGVPLPEETLSSISVVLITLILSYLTLVFGELVPKRVAMKNSEKLALGMSGLISSISTIFAPIVWTLTASTNGLLRLMGIDPNSEDDAVTEEEILMMTDAGREKGTIAEDESRIIRNIFQLDDMTVDQICTHRTDVAILWLEDSMDTWKETIRETRRSFYPICRESADEVVGILDAKSFLYMKDRTQESVMQQAVREPYFVHENMKADQLFTKMQARKADHFAVVLDEYGGMNGIITITDLVEQLVGSFSEDTLEEPAEQITKVDEDTWMIPGTMPLLDVTLELQMKLPTDDFETFGGMVIDALGVIPKDGSTSSLEVAGLHVDILEVAHHRVEMCRVKKLVQEKNDVDNV